MHKFSSTIGVRDDIDLVKIIMVLQVSQDGSKLFDLWMECLIIVPIVENLDQRVLLVLREVPGHADASPGRNPDGQHLLRQVVTLIVVDHFVIRNCATALTGNQ